jgi:hypothetical protein
MNATKWLALIVRLVGRLGDTMLRRSPRRALQAIVTKASAAIVALVGSDLKRCVTKHRNQKALNCRAATTSREAAPFSRAKLRGRSRPPQRKAEVRDTK